jgi:hypothetical protein
MYFINNYIKMNNSNSKFERSHTMGDTSSARDTILSRSTSMCLCDKIGQDKSECISITSSKNSSKFSQ